MIELESGDTSDCNRSTQNKVAAFKSGINQVMASMTYLLDPISSFEMKGSSGGHKRTQPKVFPRVGRTLEAELMERTDSIRCRRFLHLWRRAVVPDGIRKSGAFICQLFSSSSAPL
jgi:hypothetical protein